RARVRSPGRTLESGARRRLPKGLRPAAHESPPAVADLDGESALSSCGCCTSVQDKHTVVALARPVSAARGAHHAEPVAQVLEEQRKLVGVARAAVHVE